MTSQLDHVLGALQAVRTLQPSLQDPPSHPETDSTFTWIQFPSPKPWEALRIPWKHRKEVVTYTTAWSLDQPHIRKWTRERSVYDLKASVQQWWETRYTLASFGSGKEKSDMGIRMCQTPGGEGPQDVGNGGPETPPREHQFVTETASSGSWSKASVDVLEGTVGMCAGSVMDVRVIRTTFLQSRWKPTLVIEFQVEQGRNDEWLSREELQSFFWQL